MGNLFEVSGVTGAVNFQKKGTSNLAFEQGTSFPASPVTGQVFFRTDLVQFYIYDGTNWRTQAGGSLRIFNEVPSGTVNGSNTVFTAATSYVTASTVATRDGLIMKPGGVDYTETSPAAGTITFVTAPSSGSTILISYSRTIGQDVPKLTKFDCVVGTPKQTYSGSTTVFDLPFTYTVGVGSLLVYVNGAIKLVGTDYTETDSDTITFGGPQTGGHVVQFFKLGIAGGESGQTGGWNDQGTYVTLDTSTDQVRIGDGAVGTPGFAFASDPNTGIYHVGADDIGISTNGIEQLEVSTTAVTTFLPTAIKGTTTNDSASAGYVGEYVASLITTGVSADAGGNWGDMTSISLTAGDWDVSFVAAIQWAGDTITNIAIGISQASGSSTVGLVGREGDAYVHTRAWPTSGKDTFISLPAFRQSLSSTTTVYAKINGPCSGTPPLFLGRLSARRVR